MMEMVQKRRNVEKTHCPISVPFSTSAQSPRKIVMKKEPKRIFIRDNENNEEVIREEHFRRRSSVKSSNAFKCLRKVFCPCMMTVEPEIMMINKETQTSQKFVFKNQAQVQKPLI